MKKLTNLDKKKLAAKSKKRLSGSRWYKDNLRSLLGHNWAMFFAIIGGRMTGKSYALLDFLCNQKRKYGDNCKNYWLRISETSTKKLLENKANKLVDPDLVRKYDLELTTKGMDVFDHGKTFMTVLPLSAMGKTKGVALYDKDFDGYINIVLDEFQLEKGEKRTSFDILYNFIGMVENIARTNKSKLRIFLVGNTLEEASSIMKAFNFLPEQFGRFYLRRKRCIIDNLAPTEDYIKDRKGSAADLLGADTMSNYTNELKKDLSLISKKRHMRPSYVIKFDDSKTSQFIMWDDGIISRYKNQPIKAIISMKHHLNSIYIPEEKQKILDMYDLRTLKFDSLITLSYFQDEMKRLRK